MIDLNDVQFIGFAEASAARKVEKVYMRGYNAANGRTVKAAESATLLAKLIASNAAGEMYNRRWAASFTTCKELGCSTLLVDFED